MSGRIVYLDSSAIVKRYVQEPGSREVRELYLKAYSGELVLSFSLWNVGEVLSVFDRARRLGRLGGEAYSAARRRFLLETRRMSRLGSLILVPVRARLLAECWRLVEKYHIYEADALQITSARWVEAKTFLTGDGRLRDVALEEGFEAQLLG